MALTAKWIARLLMTRVGKKLLVALLRALAKRTDNKIDDEMVDALEQALDYMP